MGESSLGTLLQIGDGGATEVFTTIAEVKDINGPNLSSDEHDTTNQSSTGGWEENVASVLRSGEVTFDVNWDPADGTHDEAAPGLWGDLVAKTLRNFKLILTDTATHTITFAARVKGMSPSNPVAGVRMAAITLKPSGAITIT